MNESNEVKIEYWISGCNSPRIPWTAGLTAEEMAIYNNAIKNKVPLEDVTELEAALWRAYDEIYKYEKECAEDWGNDEFDGDIKVAFVDPLYTY